MRLSALFGTVVFVLLASNCSSSPLKYEKAQEMKKNQEFEEAVTIERPPTEPENTSSEAEVQKETEAASKDSSQEVRVPPKKTPPPKKSSVKREPIEPDTKSKKSTVDKKTSPKNSKKPKPIVQAPLIRQPDIEDTVGFAPGSRRPIVDPFRIGEEVVHDVHYFKVSAGELRLQVEPYSTVNSRRSYTFAIEIKTSSLFNAFYSVEDRAETFVDYEDLSPRAYQLHVKESGQLREAKMVFDTKKNLAKFWEKKVTKEDGEEQKKQEWEILPYSQDIYSAAFYMRIFQWDVGKEYAFRVANDNENLVFSGKAIRREVLDTKLGPMKAIVIQPNIVLKGKFKPIGDNYIWLSDDDRKYILRIESKIKIGTLVSEVVGIKPGG